MTIRMIMIALTGNKYYYKAKEVEKEDKIAADLEEEVDDNELQRDYSAQEIEEIPINENKGEEDEIDINDVDKNKINNLNDKENGSTDDKNYEEDAKPSMKTKMTKRKV